LLERLVRVGIGQSRLLGVGVN